MWSWTPGSSSPETGAAGAAGSGGGGGGTRGMASALRIIGVPRGTTLPPGAPQGEGPLGAVSGLLAIGLVHPGGDHVELHRERAQMNVRQPVEVVDDFGVGLLAFVGIGAERDQHQRGGRFLGREVQNAAGRSGNRLRHWQTPVGCRAAGASGAGWTTRPRYP